MTSTVDGAPIVVVANHDVTLENAGTLLTTGVTQTVRVNQGTTCATIKNAATGRIEAAPRGVNFVGTYEVLNNDGVIIGTGSQRNGTVDADGTANNFTLNNIIVMDAGVAGSAVPLQLGTADGDVRSCTAVNDGTLA
ncbi:hypothetical protein [Erythrobacter crassostreae]|uniref:Uncharacterized protein n=1 Tax=Erythrobacter crassostreae TaxID=2828328 RepID=A0A9X1F2F2_9SPHN|nr:hypothetical protein [Erythrobacter crassostrea]MBV7259062.1 hypothetical protein [Erythrobacter crassostrea]